MANVKDLVNAPASLNPFDQLLDLDRRSRSQDIPSLNASPQDTVGGLASRLGAWNLIFPLEQVSELIPVPHITRVPGVKPWFLGIANLRGTVIPVIDLGAFPYGQTTAPTAGNRVVIVRAGNWFYGLLAGAIIGMRHFSPQTRLANLETVETELRAYLSAGFRSEGCLWLMFDPSLLLSDRRFLDAVVAS